MSVEFDEEKDPNHEFDMDFADVLLEYLHQMKVNLVFGVPGGSIEPLFNALARSERKAEKELQYIKTPLMEFIRSAYTSKTRGNSHVVYASPSVGKTTACSAIMEYEAKIKNIQALMITGAQKDLPYITHLAKVLNVEKEEGH